MEQARGHCGRCGDTLIQKPGVSHLLHFFLSLFTVGLWIPVWILIAAKPGGWRCATCGKKVLRSVLR